LENWDLRSLESIQGMFQNARGFRQSLRKQYVPCCRVVHWRQDEDRSDWGNGLPSDRAPVICSTGRIIAEGLRQRRRRKIARSLYV